MLAQSPVIAKKTGLHQDLKEPVRFNVSETYAMQCDRLSAFAEGMGEVCAILLNL